MSHPYALIVATAEGPRSKVDPNSVLIGKDSIYPDALAQQFIPDYGPNFIAGKYTAHEVPHLTAKQAHSFAYCIRAEMFTLDEVLRMSDALK